MKKNIFKFSLLVVVTTIISFACKKEDSSEKVTYDFKKSTAKDFKADFEKTIINGALLKVGEDIIFPKAFSVSKNQLNSLLAINAAENVNLFLGLNTNNELQLVLTGADLNGKNLSTSNPANIIFSDVRLCPPSCTGTDPDDPIKNSTKSTESPYDIHEFKKTSSVSLINNLDLLLKSYSFITVGKDISFPKAFSVNRELLNALLLNNDVASVNILLGLNNLKELQLMVIGADSSGKSLNISSDTNIVFSDVRLCPPSCTGTDPDPID